MGASYGVKFAGFPGAGENYEKRNSRGRFSVQNFAVKGKR